MQDLHSGTITRAYCRAIYEESVSRCFILPPEQGWQGNTIRKGAKRPENRVTRFPPGKVVAPATKGGMYFRCPQGGCMVFATKGGIKNGAEGAVPPQWNGTSYLPRAEPSTRPGGVSRSRTEPLAPRAKGPAAPSTLTPVRACQPSGIRESTAQDILLCLFTLDN